MRKQPGSLRSDGRPRGAARLGRRAAQARPRAGRVRHRRRPEGTVEGGDVPLGEGRRARPPVRRPPTTTSPSPTSTRGSSTRRGRPTRRRSNSSRTTCPSVRTTSSSRKSMTARAAASYVALAVAAGASRPARATTRSRSKRRSSRSWTSRRSSACSWPGSSGRQRGRGREPRDRAPAAQPAADEVGPARHRGRRPAARRGGDRSSRPPMPAPTGPLRRRPAAAGGERPSHQGREGPRGVRARVRQRRLLEEARRGVPEPADRDRHGALHAARAVRVRAARAGDVDRSAAGGRTGPDLHGAKGFILRPKFIFIDGRTGAAVYSEAFREEVLYNPNQNTPGAVVVLRADGPADSRLPEHAEQPEDPGHPGPAQVEAGACANRHLAERRHLPVRLCKLGVSHCPGKPRQGYASAPASPSDRRYRRVRDYSEWRPPGEDDPGRDARRRPARRRQGRRGELRPGAARREGRRRDDGWRARSSRALASWPWSTARRAARRSACSRRSGARACAGPRGTAAPTPASP